jgi:hypothetical protein
MERTRKVYIYIQNQKIDILAVLDLLVEVQRFKVRPDFGQNAPLLFPDGMAVLKNINPKYHAWSHLSRLTGLACSWISGGKCLRPPKGQIKKPIF